MHWGQKSRIDFYLEGSHVDKSQRVMAQKMDRFAFNLILFAFTYGIIYSRVRRAELENRSAVFPDCFLG